MNPTNSTRSTVTLDPRTGGRVQPLEQAAHNAAKNLPEDLEMLRRHLGEVVGMVTRRDMDQDLAVELLQALTVVTTLEGNVADLVASVEYSVTHRDAV